MLNPRRILLIAKKEFRHILRDMRTLYLALGIPLVLLILFGYALTTDVEDIDLMVIDQDKSEASRELVASMENSGAFQVVARPDGAKEVTGNFMASRARAALVIERGYQRKLERNESAQVQLLVDGTNANDASIAIGYAGAVTNAQSMKMAKMRMPLSVKSRNWFNQALRSQWYLVPGLIAVILAMINTMLMALTVAREWERGTMEQLLVTPMQPGELIIGKLLPYLCIGIGQLVLVSGAGVLLFQVPLVGNIGLLFGISIMFLLAGLSQGLLISIITRNQQLAMMFSMLSSMLPALLLSGFMSPIASMPVFIQGLTHIIPSRYFLVVTRGIFLKGLTFEAIMFETLAICAFAVGLTAIAAKKFKGRIE